MKKICILFILTGVLLMLGTAGAADANTITLGQILRQLATGLGFAVTGGTVLRLIQMREHNMRKKAVH